MNKVLLSSPKEQRAWQGRQMWIQVAVTGGGEGSVLSQKAMDLGLAATA